MQIKKKNRIFEVGITKIKIAAITTTATMMIMAGYTMAPLILLLIFPDFSM